MNVAANAAAVPVLRLGFRPMYLLAGLYAVVHPPLWLAVYTGSLDAAPRITPAQWHAHEMLFGYTAAVIAGFLLTAVPNWTARPTPTGKPLALLAGLWLAGRIAWLPGMPWPAWAAALVDSAFLPAVVAALLPPLVGARNRRNYGFPVILLALAAANLAVHLDALGLAPGLAPRAQQTALDLVVLIMIVMGARVIPFFTGNALPDARVRRDPLLERILVVLAVLLPLSALAPGNAARAWVSLAAGLTIPLAMRGWGTRASLRVPLLWILHAGYLWIAAGLVLRGLAPHVPWLSPSAATHALTAGAVGSLTLGMMTRTALGHSGRRLAAPPPIVAAYLLVIAAALVRVGGVLALPGAYLEVLLASAALWSTAFVVFIVVYWPILTRPRIDGRPG